jgi:hypothetical protein
VAEEKWMMLGETRQLWDNWDIANTDQSLNAFWSIVKLGHDETRQPPCSGNRNMTAENRQPIVKRISVIVKLAHTGIQKTPGLWAAVFFSPSDFATQFVNSDDL